MFSLAPEFDGIVRRVPAIARIGDVIVPTLSLELLRVATGQKTYVVRTNEAGIQDVAVGRIRIPTDNVGRIWVYYGKRDLSRIVSIKDILSGTVDPAKLQGKLAFMGTSVAGLQDIRSTPLEESLPGVEVHAQILDMAMSKTFLQRPNIALGVEIVATIVASLLIIALVPILGAILTVVAGGLVVAALAAGSWLFFAEQGLLFDVTYPAGASMTVFIILTIISYIREEAEKRQVRGAFGQYLSPALVEQLADNPAQLKLGGETKNMTFLFCDVRGFTAISEQFKSDPQGLTVLINRLLTPLTGAILERNGTIDKYMGDCIMAFWNAPLDDAGHAMHACEASLAMFIALDVLNEERRLEAEEAGTDFLPLLVGAGINTGNCVVGNMGSEMRFDYSVLGDAVNLASRLEGQSKTYGVNVVLGEETVLQLDGHFPVLELDLIAVKGKTEGVRIFALMGRADQIDDPAFRRLAERHEVLLERYRAQDWDAAEAMSHELRDYEGAPTVLYDLYLERIEVYREDPPPADWDGVFVATSK